MQNLDQVFKKGLDIAQTFTKFSLVLGSAYMNHLGVFSMSFSTKTCLVRRQVWTTGTLCAVSCNYGTGVVVVFSVSLWVEFFVNDAAEPGFLLDEI